MDVVQAYYFKGGGLGINPRELCLQIVSPRAPRPLNRIEFFCITNSFQIFYIVSKF